MSDDTKISIDPDDLSDLTLQETIELEDRIGKPLSQALGTTSLVAGLAWLALRRQHPERSPDALWAEVMRLSFSDIEVAGDVDPTDGKGQGGKRGSG